MRNLFIAEDLVFIILYFIYILYSLTLTNKVFSPFIGDHAEWYRPISLDELIKIRHLYPGRESKLLVGNTEVQIETKFKNSNYPRFVAVSHIPELIELSLLDDEIIVGASVTLTRLQKQLMQWQSSFQSRGQKLLVKAILDQLKHFGSNQVRNVASIGGNIINASPM